MTCLPVIKATSGWVQNGGKYLVYTDDRTNKKYASSLQSIIEKNNLQKYDQMLMKEMKAQGKSFGTETNPRQQGEQSTQKTSVSKPAESEKYSFLQRFFVPLHQQSKESYFVPKGGYL